MVKQISEEGFEIVAGTAIPNSVASGFLDGTPKTYSVPDAAPALIPHQSGDESQKFVEIYALESNSGMILIGNASVSTDPNSANYGRELAAGKSLSYPLRGNIVERPGQDHKLYWIATAAGQKATITVAG